MPALGTQSFLLFVSQIAGILLLVSTMLLVGLRRIYIDKETNQPIEFEFPLLGKVKTQVPALFLIAAGVLLVIFPLQKGGADQATIEGSITAPEKSATVIVLAVPQQYQTTVDASGPFSMNVPLIGNAQYRVKFEIDRQIVAEQQGELVKNRIQLKPVVYVPPPRMDGKSVKGVSDETLKTLGIQ
ncbi:MAG: hypothetical protein ABSH44_11150 [Bryobacteraceae bacterium]|jgi:hypothetical protein